VTAAVTPLGPQAPGFRFVPAAAAAGRGTAREVPVEHGGSRARRLTTLAERRTTPTTTPTATTTDRYRRTDASTECPCLGHQRTSADRDERTVASLKIAATAPASRPSRR